MKRCVNHPLDEATKVGIMPSADKQPDGSYDQHVPFCEACAARIEAIGFPVRSA